MAPDSSIILPYLSIAHNRFSAACSFCSPDLQQKVVCFRGSGCRELTSNVAVAQLDAVQYPSKH
eukprot:5490636-Heterocapsa_arctica.AAC.1